MHGGGRHPAMGIGSPSSAEGGRTVIMVEVLTLFVLLALPAAVVTAIVSEILLRRGRRASVWVAVAASLIVTPLTFLGLVVALTNWREVTWRQFWEGDAKPGAAELLLPIMGVHVIAALLLSAGVVWLYPRRGVMISQ
ncbi:MAG: hypothetical protein BGO12_20220 [Verrucomicrobia bacterium 61-8]|nr:MAG: hypothetical protein BGO12_20220 [Verrucomicrobia bacterium 61-8]